MDGPAEKLYTVFQQIIAKSVSVEAKQCLQGRTQDLELGGGGGGALRAEGRKGGWVREGASPPPTPAKGYGGAL